MKHLKSYKSINESNNQHFETVEDAITVDGVKIDLDYDMDCDDDYIAYTLSIHGDQMMKLANLGIIFNAIDYADLDNENRIELYQIMVTVPQRKLDEYGVYSTSELKAIDAYELIEKKIKFKFDKKFTAKEFVKFCNNVDIQSVDASAVLKTNEEKTKHLGAAAKQKELSQFLGSLTQKDYFFLGRDLNYFDTLPRFKNLRKHGVTVEEAVNFCLKAVGVEDWEKSDKLRNINNRSGIMD